MLINFEAIMVLTTCKHLKDAYCSFVKRNCQPQLAVFEVFLIVRNSPYSTSLLAPHWRYQKEAIALVKMHLLLQVKEIHPANVCLFGLLTQIVPN